MQEVCFDQIAVNHPAREDSMEPRFGKPVRLAVLLGPYRNLTTLTTAVLALHPNVQALNHAAERLWRRDGLDFVAEPTAAVFTQFLATAMRESEGGSRGDYGGSI